MALTPQLAPTDFGEIDKAETREEREALYANNAIYAHEEAQGRRFTKGNHPSSRKRSWQSLDKILRSDKHASAALPYRELRLSRLFTALTVIAGITAVAGAAASAREGLDLKRVRGAGAVLLGGGIAAVAFGITAGVFYGRAKRGYERSVDIYNDSLGMRLGVLTPGGEYVPPKGVLIDEEGYVVLDQAEAGVLAPAKPEGPKKPEKKPEPAPEPEPAPDAEAAQPAPDSPSDEAETPKADEPEKTDSPPIQRPAGQPETPSGNLSLSPRSSRGG